MKSMKLIKAVVLIYLLGLGIEAIGNTINVDNLTPESITGDILASQGVTFTSGTVNTDAVSVGDTIRLTFAPHSFNVLALDEGSSDAASAPENLLSVGLGGAPFDYALFQVTGSGAEGFDDLTFSPVPLPATAWLFSIGLGVLWITARRHGSTS